MTGTSQKYKMAGAFKEGDSVKWNHASWHKVLKISVVGGWAYFELEGFHRGCTIWYDVDLPWRRF